MQAITFFLIAIRTLARELNCFALRRESSCNQRTWLACLPQTLFEYLPQTNSTPKLTARITKNAAQNRLQSKPQTQSRKCLFLYLSKGNDCMRMSPQRLELLVLPTTHSTMVAVPDFWCLSLAAAYLKASFSLSLIKSLRTSSARAYFESEPPERERLPICLIRIRDLFWLNFLRWPFPRFNVAS